MIIKTLTRGQAQEAMSEWVNNFPNLPAIDADFQQLRNDLQAINETVRNEIANKPDLKKEDYYLEYRFGILLYDYLNKQQGFSLRVASNDGFWRFLSVVVVPDIVSQRWGKDNDSHFWSQPSRNWFRSLWWYVHLAWQGDMESTNELLSTSFFSTDTILNFEERTGRKGTYVEVYRQIIKCYGMIQNQLTALFNHATKIYGLKSNPCHKVKKMGKSDAVGIEFWTYDEYKEFRKTLEPGSKYYVLFQILFFTGIRIGELLALTIEDFDFSNNTLSITKTFYRLKGKPTITAPKTENSVRTIDIPSSLAKEVKEYYEKLYQYPEDERLFDISHEAVQHKMARNTEKAGIKKIRVHDLRHSAVAFLIHKGVQPEIIKERMGHKDITITLNTYGHLYPSAQKEVAEMLDEVNRASDENEGSDE